MCSMIVEGWWCSFMSFCRDSSGWCVCVWDARVEMYVSFLSSHMSTIKVRSGFLV